MDVRKFFIKPQIPERLKPLEALAHNIWAFWDKDAEKLFHRLDPQLYRKVAHNPVEFLYRLDEEKILAAAKDRGFLYELGRVSEKFKNYLEFDGTYVKDGVEKTFSPDDIVLYSCMEYGLHESLAFYSGGLAVLAGDHLKAASDVGIPMIGFGLLYKRGYFSQRISSDGMQIEEFKQNNWHLAPVNEVVGADGAPVYIEIPLKNEKVIAKLWKIEVGKTILYLIDTNIHQNPERFRKITDLLYDSDRVVRLQQELILGRGCIIALRAMGIKPTVYHINEGHTAFSVVERILWMMREERRSFEEAKAIVRSSTVFTTHTPVIEGNEHFDEALIREYFIDEVKELGIDINSFLAFGRIASDRTFWLPAFAIRFSRLSNGVSKLHGEVSRKMWRSIFPNLHERELPIKSVTNGVHLQSWLSLQMTEIFDRYIGPDYLHKAEALDVWEKVEDIPDGEIWNAHCRRKDQVVSFIRRRVGNMMQHRGYGKNKIKDIEQVLNPSTLTIGFARRFAPYKRANLVLTDPERFAAIIKNRERPVQIIFAGKAHPADDAGKRIIKQLFDFIYDYKLENHVVFIEDYDINIARHLVQGVDVWLNTPTKPMEASGTSGMKAAINGALNLSVPDGWWPEAYDGENGWEISAGDNIEDPGLARMAESNQIYELLENEITEMFYDRREGGHPKEWVEMMKRSIIAACSRFNMHRPLREYLYDYYMPQAELTSKITANDGEMLKRLIAHREVINSIWSRIYLRDYFTSIDGKMPTSGDNVEIEAYVYVDDVDTELIGVEAFYCFGDEPDEWSTSPLKFVEKYNDKVARYSGSVMLDGNGTQEISVRIVPADRDFRAFYPEYVKWKP
ncbi:MAG TPA: alpha-glucan family phosphorylase [bacterium]|nr:glycosyltransferase family 1 protein [Myxococcales bacterium]HQH79845.1 alpha-glucan family phosphorylase [bacterium]